MVERVGNIKQRIERWIKHARSDGKRIYQFCASPQSTIVREINKEGEAHVECPVPDGAECLTWHLESVGSFLFLQSDKCADGAFLLFHPDGRVEAHIIECKKKVDNSKWREAKEQFQDSLVKLLALCGILGIDLSRIHLGTAFRDCRLDELETTNPRFAPVLIDAESDDASVRVGARQREFREWRTGEVHLRGFATAFPLTKIQLDPETGNGKYDAPS